MKNYVVIDYDKYGEVLRELFPKQVIHELFNALSDNDVFLCYVDEKVVDEFLEDLD